ncbi:MAG: MBOAT family protein, partial [Magnetospirillum sp.]
MMFHSYLFMFVFLPAVLAVFHGLRRHSIRWSVAWLLLASLAYYGWWSPKYAALLLGAGAVNFMIARRLRRASHWLPLAAGIGFNLALLGYFKYAMFLSGTWSDLTGVQWRLSDIALPLGISFFTFQQITYLNHAKDGKASTGGLLEHALFTMFFPTMIAGPILHQSELLPRLLEKRHPAIGRDLAIGLTIFTLGLFKKVVLAETLAGYADPAFNAAAGGAGITFIEAWAGATAFTFQLYFDFSGYSDMAIGLARLFGLRLPANFNSPLKSTSIIEFWQRWHMTLTRFLTAYIFNPIVLR